VEADSIKVGALVAHFANINHHFKRDHSDSIDEGHFCSTQLGDRKGEMGKEKKSSCLG